MPIDKKLVKAGSQIAAVKDLKEVVMWAQKLSSFRFVCCFLFSIKQSCGKWSTQERTPILQPLPKPPHGSRWSNWMKFAIMLWGFQHPQFHLLHLPLVQRHPHAPRVQSSCRKGVGALAMPAARRVAQHPSWCFLWERTQEIWKIRCEARGSLDHGVSRNTSIRCKL